MNFSIYLALRREAIKSHLFRYMQAKNTSAKDATAHKALDRLTTFATSGKMLRGTFVMMGYEMYAAEVGDPVEKVRHYVPAMEVAAALELSHASLLIHDDIIDNDLRRRGDKTMHAQYRDDAKAMQLSKPAEYGKSMGLIVGDTSLLLTYDMFASIEVGEDIRAKLLKAYSHEMLKVTLGQFLDYQYGCLANEQSVLEIERVYSLKTGSYTFTLPFMLGAILAGKSPDELKPLKKLTHNLGIVFQMRDDELGLFGEPKLTGKPIGSDISENKKTLFRSRLFEVATRAEKSKLQKIFGTKADAQGLKYVRQLAEKNGVLKELQSKVKALSKSASRQLPHLQIHPHYKNFIEELIKYNSEREG